MSWNTAFIIINAARRLSSPVLQSVQAAQPLSRTLLASQLTHRHSRSASFPGTRSFHASLQRQALPVLPLLLLKSSSVLPATITLARVLLSFFPVVSLFGFRIRRKAETIKRSGRPEISPVAEAFVKKWCPDERGRRFTFLQVSTMNLQQRKAMIRHVEGSPSSRMRVDGDKYLHFLLPALPPASLTEYSKMSAEEKEHVYLYRRYRASDRFSGEVVGRWRWILFSIIGLPALVVLVAMIAAIERVPITGRWRIILMSPDEEDAISSELIGEKWFKSVIALLSTPERPAPPILPENDWRWKWVDATLRRLEVAALADCASTDAGNASPKSTPLGLSTTDSFIAPPPPDFPLKPRPRASAALHSALPGGDATSGKEHLLVGPPYSLMLFSKDEANAFSYGFGGRGAGGIVVYSGLLENIVAKSPSRQNQSQAAPSPWQALMRLFSQPTLPAEPLTTPEQDFHLATVLAHELGHLMLSHHLETLSSRQVLWPSVIGLATDLVRVVVWPVTFIFGPLINDGLSNISKTSVNLLKERIELPLSRVQELEADLVGLRLLARAGYDAEAALDIWGDHITHLAESPPNTMTQPATYQKHWANPSTSHPQTRERIEAVRRELERWRNQA